MKASFLNCFERFSTFIYYKNGDSTLFLLDKVDALFRMFASVTRRIVRGQGFSGLVPGYANFM